MARLLLPHVDVNPPSPAGAPESHDLLLQLRYGVYVFCLLYLALFLTMVLRRCLLRQLLGPTDDERRSTPATSQLVMAALEEADIPVVIYIGVPAAPEADSVQDDEDGARRKRPSEECTVCLEEIVAGEEVRVMPRCGHMYHRPCIDEWLRRGPFGTCPLCRDKVILRTWRLGVRS